MTFFESDADKELGRIKDRIRQLCEAGLSTGRLYYLSRLGIDLGKDMTTLRLLTGMRLSEFFNEHFHGEFSLVPVGPHKNVPVVVRSSPEPDEEKEQVAARAALPAKHEVIYHYRFWAAFSVHLPEDRRRFLDRRTFYFKNIGRNEEPPPGWLPIDEEFIARPDIIDRDEAIKSNIEKWLEKYSLSRDEFVSNSPTRDARSRQETVLSAMISALDKRQLEETHLSLDVVAALLQRYVRR